MSGETDEDIVACAKKDLAYGLDRESYWRDLYVKDVRFGNADSDNGDQWPSQLRIDRSLEQKPCLTINKTRQHCLQIINDSRQNKSDRVAGEQEACFRLREAGEHQPGHNRQ